MRPGVVWTCGTHYRHGLNQFYCAMWTGLNIETYLKFVKSINHVLQEYHKYFLSYDTACNLSLVHARIKHINDCPQVCDILNCLPIYHVIVGVAL